jgi:hypothetical protein
MADQDPNPDPLLVACDALLREVAGYPLSADRLEAAVPLIREILSAIRMMDEVDVSASEPMTTFRPLP